MKRALTTIAFSLACAVVALPTIFRTAGSVAGRLVGNRSKVGILTLLTRLSRRFRRLGRMIIGMGSRQAYWPGLRLRRRINRVRVNYCQLKAGDYFMKQNTSRETSPRTAPPRFSTDDFDCELPPEARDELFTHKRPRILGRPVKNSHGLRRLGVAALVLVVLAAIVVIAFWSWQRSLPHPAPVAPTVPAVSLPIPTPTASLATVWTPEVRRAEPVPVVVKRAILFRLPSQELGVYKWYPLPDAWGGASVRAR